MQIKLNNQEIHILKMYGGATLDLDRNNRRPVICKDCEKPIETGEGFYRKAFCATGFVCVRCLQTDALARTYDMGFKDHDAGFRLVDGRLQQCYTGYPPREFRTLEVLDEIQREWKYQHTERLVAVTTATQKIIDTSESIQIGG